MVFSSVSFLFFFLPLLLIFYYASSKKYRNFILVIFSLLFYFWGEKKFVNLLLLTCFFNYLFGLWIPKGKKKILIIGLCFNLGLLFYYKYCNFFFNTFSTIFSINIKSLSIVLPLGISFFTFQNISYLVDVYRGQVKEQTNFLKYATYITFFPQLIAGPILRYKDMALEIDKRNENLILFGEGTKRFTIGLAKKTLLANTIYQMYTSILSSSMSSLSYVLVALGFLFQIYYDFSGYSDMAIGLGKMFGFSIKENFDYPLIASSITDFWRRWHISLSHFFRDYLYIPLGGNKKGILKTIRNLAIVWFCTGLWHGANWNFVVWGLYFLAFLLLEKYVWKREKKKIYSIFTFCIVLIGFILFNTSNLNEFFLFLKGMFGINTPFINRESLYYLKQNSVLLFVSFLGMSPFLKKKIEILRKGKLKKGVEVGEIIYFLFLLLLSTASIISSSFQPFIYFRF